MPALEKSLLNNSSAPMPYSGVNYLLQEFMHRIRGILGQQFLGMYLYGSLALGDFDPETSDIDFLVVTEGEISEAHFALLSEMHEQIAKSGSPWARQVEAAYIPREALNHTTSSANYPQLEKGTSLYRAPLEPGWTFQRFTLHECGVTLAGPDQRSLVDPVDPAEMSWAAAAILGMWAEQSLHDPEWIAWVREWSCLAFVTLTICRMLYSLETESITSKPGAARWALHSVDPRWAPLIERSLVSQQDHRNALDSDLEEMLAFLAHARKRGGFEG